MIRKFGTLALAADEAGDEREREDQGAAAHVAVIDGPEVAVKEGAP